MLTGPRALGLPVPFPGRDFMLWRQLKLFLLHFVRFCTILNGARKNVSALPQYPCYKRLSGPEPRRGRLKKPETMSGLQFYQKPSGEIKIV